MTDEKKTFQQQQADAAARARALGRDDLADRIEKKQYAAKTREAIAELEAIEAAESQTAA